MIESSGTDPGLETKGRLASTDSEEAVSHFGYSGPRRALRSRDLPLYELPEVSLVPQVREDGVHVHLQAEPVSLGIRWETDGKLTGEGRDVVWQPACDDDQLRVAVRTRGGVAITSLRASQLVRSGWS